MLHKHKEKKRNRKKETNKGNPMCSERLGYPIKLFLRLSNAVESKAISDEEIYAPHKHNPFSPHHFFLCCILEYVEIAGKKCQSSTSNERPFKCKTI